MTDRYQAAAAPSGYVIIDTNTYDALVDENGLTITFAARESADSMSSALNSGECFPAAPNDPDHPMWH